MKILIYHLFTEDQLESLRQCQANLVARVVSHLPPNRLWHPRQSGVRPQLQRAQRMGVCMST